jgi:hypothetical protein
VKDSSSSPFWFIAGPEPFPVFDDREDALTILQANKPIVAARWLIPAGRNILLQRLARMKYGSGIDRI